MSEHKLILGVDPGTTKTAFVVFNLVDNKPVSFDHIPNHDLLKRIMTGNPAEGGFNPDVKHMAIEMMASMGLAVGQSTLETAVWIGRFIQAWISKPGNTYELVYRLDEKLHLCGDARAKDPNIRQSIMDRYGSSRELAIGNSKAPGPLFGVSKDVWAAIAVVLTAAELPADARRAKGSLTL